MKEKILPPGVHSSLLPDKNFTEVFQSIVSTFPNATFSGSNFFLTAEDLWRGENRKNLKDNGTQAMLWES